MKRERARWLAEKNTKRNTVWGGLKDRPLAASFCHIAAYCNRWQTLTPPCHKWRQAGGWSTLSSSHSTRHQEQMLGNFNVRKKVESDITFQHCPYPPYPYAGTELKCLTKGQFPGLLDTEGFSKSCVNLHTSWGTLIAICQQTNWPLVPFQLWVKRWYMATLNGRNTLHQHLPVLIGSQKDDSNWSRK